MTVSSSYHWLGQGSGRQEERHLKLNSLVLRLHPVGKEHIVNTLQVLVLVEGFKVGKMDIMELVRVCIARGLGSLCYNCSYSSVVVMGG